MFCGALSGLAGCGLFAGGALEGAPAPLELAEREPETPGTVSNFLDRMIGSPSSSPAATTDAPTAPLVTENTAALTIPVVPDQSAERSGFFGLLGGFRTDAATDGTETSAVPPGGLLAYGDLATVCGLSPRNLGREVESKSGYTVYDTAPSTTAPRTHFITGFSDGCARQFTAALAIFGDIGTHEIVRYGAADGGLAYTETDNAYEEIKAGFCGVRAGRPCGARLERMARRSTFLTVYERFGSNPVWADILLHNGQVIAMDFKGD